MQETWVWSLGQEDPLEKEMATHSSILPWRRPWTEELQRIGSQRVGMTKWLTFTFTFKLKQTTELGWTHLTSCWFTSLRIFLWGSCSFWGFPGGSGVKNLPAMQEPQEIWVWSLGQEDPLEEGMATHSNILAWRIPWTEEPGGLQSTGLRSQTWLKPPSMPAQFLPTRRQVTQHKLTA